MISTVKIDRQKLAKYLQLHAKVIAQSADVDVDLAKIESFDGNVLEFLGTVRIDIRDIPLQFVVADPQSS